MAKSTVVRISHTKSNTVPWGINQAAGESRREAVALAALFERIAGGHEACTFEVCPEGTTLVRASATATLVSAGAGDAITINGVEFAAVASGATGNQWNLGADDAGDATNLAAAINASTTAKVQNYVTATSASNVVTIRAKQPGLAGNMFTLTDTGTTITVTGSGFLTGGAGDEITAVTYTRS